MARSGVRIDGSKAGYSLFAISLFAISPPRQKRLAIRASLSRKSRAAVSIMMRRRRFAAAAKDPTDADWMIRMMVCMQEDTPASKSLETRRCRASPPRTIRIYGGLDCCFQFLGRAKGVVACGLLPFATLVGAAPFLMDRGRISMSVRVYLTIAATVEFFTVSLSS